MRQILIFIILIHCYSSFGQAYNRSEIEFNQIFSKYFEDRLPSDFSLPDSIKDGYYKFYDNERIIAECLVKNHSLFKKTINSKSKIRPEFYSFLKSIIYNYPTELDLKNFRNTTITSFYDTTNYRFTLEFNNIDNYWQKSTIVSECVSYIEESPDYRHKYTATILKDVNEGLYWKQADEVFNKGIKTEESIYYWGHSYKTQQNTIWHEKIDNVYTGFNIFTSWDTLGNILTQTCNDSLRKYYLIKKVYDKGKLTAVYKSKYLKRKKAFMEYKYIDNKLVSKDLYERNNFARNLLISIYHKDYK